MAQCFRRQSSNVEPWANETPCREPTDDNDVVDCCGPGSICLGNGVCFITGDKEINQSGYFVASCTDSTYEDTACRQECTNLARSDIVYLGEGNQWSCCDVNATGQPKCNDPNTGSFNLAPPEDLLAAYSSSLTATTPTSTSSSSATSQTSATEILSSISSSATSASTSSPTSSPVANEDSSIGGGTIAGIVVGAVAGIALIAGGVFWMRRRMRKSAETRGYSAASRQDNPGSHRRPAYTSGRETKYTDVSSQHQQPMQELDASARPAEMAGSERPRVQRYEMSA